MMDQRFMQQLLSQLTSASNKIIEELKGFPTPKCIQFATGDDPIIFYEQNKGVHSSNDCENYDIGALQSSLYWHQILVHHDGQHSKEEVLEAFFDVVDGELFIPIGYRRGSTIDYFFISKEFGAMKKIFDRKLLIPSKERSLQVVVKVGVAECQNSHRFYLKINTVLTKCIKQSTTLGGNRALNCDEFGHHPEFKEMCINLGNQGTLDLILSQLNGHQQLKGNSPFRIFKFANNGIKNLFPFSVLHNLQMEILDLSFNKIKDIEELKILKFFNIQELYIKGNECCNNLANYMEIVREILPKLRKLDNVPIVSASSIYKTNIKGQAIKIGNKTIPNESIKDGTSISLKNRIVMLKTLYNLRDDNYWSKVLVHHDDQYKREQILRVLAKDVCFNSTFFPCYSKRFKNRDEFFLYKNFDAIKIMMQKCLKVPMNSEGTVQYNIHINFNVAEFKEEQVDWSENLKYVISHRIKNNKLNLNDFFKEELLSNIYICFDNCNNLNFILDQCRHVSNQLTEISLENCGLSKCEGLSVLGAFDKLKMLNLRNNNIEKLDGIRRSNTIVEVFLDGNPICNQDPIEYTKAVGNYFPSLQWLDGHRVHQENFLITFKNYLVTIDVYTVVGEFLNHFFTLWDSFERHQLKQMYRKNSMLTMCINYEFNKEKEVLPFNEIYPRVQKYVNFDRNLKKISNLSKVVDKVYIGMENIKRLLNDLPKTKHDLTNCNIDVPYFDPEKPQIVIIVSGFMEDLSNDQPFLLGFTRTFIIESRNCEFYITNDQMLFRNPTIAQREAASKKVESAKYNDLIENCRDLLPTEMESKTLKLVMLQELMQCKKEYCLKLLEENFWDIKVTLALFNENMNENRIPDEVFNIK